MELNNYGISVSITKDFFIIKETLERMGIANKSTKVITPSCYIISEDDGTYKIYHFKELLARDGFKKEIEQIDIERRNAILSMLVNWNLIIILSPDIYQKELLQKIFVLSHNEKDQYTINHKYQIKDGQKNDRDY